MNKALFIGHSLVGQVMPAMFNDFMTDQGSVVQADVQVINGAPLRYNWDNGDGAQGVNARTVLPSGEYGIVVVTEAIPLDDQILWNDSQGYAKRYYDLAISANADTQFYLYETWHEIGVDAQEWRDQIATDLSKWQGIIEYVNDNAPSDAPEAFVLPAGQAMAMLHDRIEAGQVTGLTSIHELFSDNIHLNDIGNWFIAALYAAALSDVDVAALPLDTFSIWGTPYGGPDAALAQEMADVIEDTVAQFLPQGSDPGPDPLIGDDDDNVLTGDSNDDFLDGRGGHDEIYGAAGDDTILGDTGNDTLEGGADDDVIDGGTGYDTALYSGAFSEYSLDLNNDGSLTVTSERQQDAGTDLLTNIQEVHFSDGVFAGQTFVKTAIPDLNNDHAWSSYIDTFDINGDRTLRVMTYDNGSVVESTYDDGVRTSTLATDAAAAFNWLSISTTFDENKLRTEETKSYDNGRVLETLFVGGIRSEATMSDVADAYSWSSHIETYDVDGDRTERSVTYDDGSVIESIYNAGVRISTLVTDAADDFNWSSISTTFDENKLRTEETKSFDNGRVLETLFVGGVQVEATMNDVTGTYSWTRYTDTYDVDGDRTERLITYDDGSVVESTYDNGVRTSKLVTDAAGDFNWLSISTTFDENKLRTEETKNYDDGRVLETFFVGGVRTETTMSDVTDAYSWSSVINMYDFDGNRTERLVTYDDGSTNNIFF